MLMRLKLNMLQEKVKKMTIRDLVEKTNVTYNQVEIHKNGEIKQFWVHCEESDYYFIFVV